MNSLKLFPSSRQASSDWSSRFNPLRNKSFNVSSTHAVWATSVRKSRAYSTADFLLWKRVNSWSPKLYLSAGCSKTSQKCWMNVSRWEMMNHTSSRQRWPTPAPFRWVTSKRKQCSLSLWDTTRVNIGVGSLCIWRVHHNFWGKRVVGWLGVSEQVGSYCELEAAERRPQVMICWVLAVLWPAPWLT